jgi:hypothetical protein
MQTYTAPLRDMRFVIHEVHDSASLAKLPGLEEVTPELLDTILDEAAKFIAAVLLPLNASGDAEGCHYEDGVVRTPKGFKEAYRAFVEGGWGSLSSDPKYGGQGLPESAAKLVEEMICGCNLAFGLYPGLSHGASLALQSHGSDALKNLYLPKLIDGSWTGTMCLTESHCGTDLGLLLPAERLEDFHLRRRTRPDREHRPFGAGAHAGCAAGHQGHQLVRGAEVSAECRRQRRRAQWRQVHSHRTQDGHQGLGDLPDQF